MLNKVILGGRLTADPELKETAGGQKVCTFSLACERDYISDDGTHPVDFFKFVAYHGKAENCSELLRKGLLVMIEGRMQQNRYTVEGKKRQDVEVMVDRFYLVTPKREAALEPAPDVPW